MQQERMFEKFKHEIHDFIFISEKSRNAAYE